MAAVKSGAKTCHGGRLNIYRLAPSVTSLNLCRDWNGPEVYSVAEIELVPLLLRVKLCL